MASRPHMPALDGATEWLTPEPLGPAELRGHVVLVNFWTLTCINWLRQAPHLKAWARAYCDDGLIVIGVHTPEFSFEHVPDRVRQAVVARSIRYPVVIDNDFAVWGAFANHYWPALFFIDADGVIRDEYYGEGRYEESERLIQRLLGVERDLVAVESVGVEAPADWDHLRTPEPYLGYGRSERFVTRDGHTAFDARHAYEPPERLDVNRWTLSGEWTIAGEAAVLEHAGGTISCRFHARDAHLVLAGGNDVPIPFRVLIDGDVPGLAHGVDVDEQGNGVLREGRLYQLVRQRAQVEDRRLDVTFLDARAEVYAFTYG